MATIDRSRDATQPLKHYAGVRMQQGRVLTDDDFNEAAALEAEGARRALIDVVGPYGSPDDGFKVIGTSVEVDDTDNLIDLTLKAGTIYVGGLRVELEEDVQLCAQPDFLLQRDEDRTYNDENGHLTYNDENGHLVYLEVWQQPVSAVEDGELFEEALGGADTSQRMRTMARVRIFGVDDTSCSGAWTELTSQLQEDGRGEWEAETAALSSDLRLFVDFDDTGDEEDLCAPEIAEGYLGARNTAIRVQLVDPADTGFTAAFTWGYDNGAPLYRVSINELTDPDRTEVTFLTEPKDQAHWPLAGQHVELVPLSAILNPNRELVGEGHGRCEEQAGGELLSVGHGHLATVDTDYEPPTETTSGTVILDGHPPDEFNTLASAHDDDGVMDDRDFECYLRVWDRGTDLSSNSRIGITPDDGPVTLGNTGIRVRLTGDYIGADAHWIIAARPNTPSQVVPWDLQLDGGRAPHGVTTYLCPLAVIDWPEEEVANVQDCRQTFRPLTRIKTCCTVTVGDGEVSHGDYPSIQDAIDNLPPEGGEVCVLPGSYTDPITIRNRSDIRVYGCGERSSIEVTNGDATPAVLIVNGERITLDGLRIVAPEFWCVRVTEDDGDTRGVTIKDCTLRARDYGAVTFDTGSTLTLADSHLTAEELAEAEASDPHSPAGRIPLVWTQGTNVRIINNTITAAGDAPIQRGAGGVRIAGYSADVWVDDNHIIGGNGVGISLGSITVEDAEGDVPAWSSGLGIAYYYWEDDCLKQGYSSGGYSDPDEEVVLVSEGIVEDVEIRRNRIHDMSADGIAAAWFFDDAGGNWSPDAIIVYDLLIADNVISNCCRGAFVEISDYLTNNVSHGGITLAHVNRLRIHGDEIVDNGVGRNVALAVISTWLATGVVIKNVHAENNGSGTTRPTNEFAGGLILRLVMPDLSDAPQWRGLDALTIQGNRISVPQGRPLAAFAFGPVSVRSNVLTSLRVRGAVNAPSVGTGIFLLNLGNLLGRWGEEFGGEGPRPPSGGSAGLVHFVDNEVTIGAGVEGENIDLLFQHFLASFDSVSAYGNTFRADIPGNIPVHIPGNIPDTLVDVWGFARAAHGVNNRIVETPGKALVSMLWWGTVASELTANMATHCFLSVDPYEGVGEGKLNRSLYDYSSWATEIGRCHSLVGRLTLDDLQPAPDPELRKEADEALDRIERTMRGTRPTPEPEEEEPPDDNQPPTTEPPDPLGGGPGRSHPG